MGGRWSGLVLRVESGVLEEAQDLDEADCTLSRVSVLARSARKVLRYDISERMAVTEVR